MIKQFKVVNHTGSFFVDIYTLEDFNQDFNIGDLKIGVKVAEDVIDHLRNNLPPVTDWSFLFQSGGAECDRITEDGKLHPAYATFVPYPTAELPACWEYRGSCLKGEQTERGEIPIYERKPNNNHYRQDQITKKERKKKNESYPG